MAAARATARRRPVDETARNRHKRGGSARLSFQKGVAAPLGGVRPAASGQVQAGGVEAGSSELDVAGAGTCGVGMLRVGMVRVGMVRVGTLGSGSFAMARSAGTDWLTVSVVATALEAPRED